MPPTILMIYNLLFSLLDDVYAPASYLRVGIAPHINDAKQQPHTQTGQIRIIDGIALQSLLVQCIQGFAQTREPRPAERGSVPLFCYDAIFLRIM